MAATGKGSGLFSDFKELSATVNDHTNKLEDHEERLDVAEERLDMHERDISDLAAASDALKRINARHVAFREKRLRSRRPPRK